MATRIIKLPWTSTFADSPSASQDSVACEWMRCADMLGGKGTIEAASMTTNHQVKLFYQTCNVVDSPDTATTFGNQVTQDELNFSSAFVTLTNTDARELVRFGFAATNSTGTSWSFGRTSAIITILGR